MLRDLAVQKLEKIFDECGLIVIRITTVGGGDINEAFCITTSTGKYFLKINDAMQLPGMFIKEANGLNMLRDRSALKVPHVIKTGVVENRQYILLEWLEKGPVQNETWNVFGLKLARMHRHKGSAFGLDDENYIGSLRQTNTMNDSWSTFYTACRIDPLVKMLFDSRLFSVADIDSANKFYKRLDDLFPAEPPALLHGDLWGGNFLITSNGDAAIYDPAIYFGHREMDIGMTKLFGGFDPSFYNAYNEFYPLEKGWENRLPLTQLYPILVHAVLFGGHYVARSKEIIADFS